MANNSNDSKKYVSLTRLSNFLDNIKAKYSKIGHKHTMSDLTDYKVDTTLSSTSNNPIANKTVDAEFDAIATAMGALDLAIDGKADASHTHDDRYYTESEIDTKLASKANSSHNHDSAYDAKGSASTVQENLDAVSDTLDAHTANSNIHFTAAERTKLSGIAAGAQVNTVTGVKGNSESTYRTGNINITKANIGLGNVDNTADANKSVKHATSADSATSATKATQDGNGKVISSTYETKSDASAKLTEAKTYADNAASAVKNDLLNGAGTAYDTLKELGDLIDDNKDAIDALNDVAAGKANAVHTHAISDVTNLQSTLDGKAAKSHGTHVAYSTTAPVMDGTAAVGTASTVARSDHKHPTDTSRASKTEFDSHTSNTTVHITATERTNWNAAKTHADSAHAPSNAQPNQNAFSNIAVSGQTTVAADTTTDTVTFAGSNVSITTDATNDKVTFSVADGTVDNKGIVRLSNSYSSTYTDRAATPQAVKYAYDRADEAYELAETKQDEITGAATTIAKSDLLTSRALVSNSSGKIAASSVTSTELEYLDGVTSNIQDQLDDKAAYSHTHSAAHITSGIMDAARLPDASDTKEGVVTTGTQSFAGNKTFTGKVIAAGITSNGNIGAGAANTYNVGTSLAPFKGIYTQDLYVDAKIVAGSVLDGGSFRRETEGTTSTKGVTNLTVGNYITKGKNGNAQGYITVYNENNGATILSTSHTTGSDYNLKFPAHGGTLVTTSDLESLAQVQIITWEADD
jgi:hypothetical protein